MEGEARGGSAFATRRGFIQAGAAFALDFDAGLRRWFEQWRALGHRPEAKRVTPYLTPNRDFYLVAVDPDFRPGFDARDVEAKWSLELVGVDGTRRRYGYGELAARADREVVRTFECIGNEVGGRLIGNARWRVLPLADLLDEAAGGAQSAASVRFEGLDGFGSSVSTARARDPEAFLALRMNGDALPAAHGFPARVILPDLYGMKQPRWLRRIDLRRAAGTSSYWERRGWAGEVSVKTMSRIDRRETHAAGVPLDLTGVAYAGRRGVSAVEVSLDGGAHWVACELLPPSIPGAWTLWQWHWPAPTAGRYTLAVRARDGRGRWQTALSADPFPDGASGLDTEDLRVARAG